MIFYFLEIRFLLFHANKLSPLNKKFDGKKYAILEYLGYILSDLLQIFTKR